MAEVRAPLTTERIVDEAVGLIRERGPEGLSMRALAARMGVTAPAFYTHVPNREALARACAEYGYDRLSERFGATEAGTAVERARAACIAYVRFSLEEPELFRLMIQFRPGAIDLDVPNEHGAASALFDRMIANLAEAIGDGALAPADPLDYGMALWAAVHGVATVASMAPGLDADALVRRVVDSMLSGWAP